MNGELKKIFAVDDNPENLTALRNTLRDIYVVYPCPSALEMFGLLEHVQPDLILLDVEMPQMNGYEAVKKLKSSDKYKDIPVIFLTYMIDEQSEIEGLKLGAVDYIHKPFITPLLLQRIDIHLSMVEHKLEAEHASRAKSEFLSHMSHEIRSPLTAVIGMINIATKTDDVQTIKKYLEKAGNASNYVMGVINDILDISKIEANKLEFSFAEFNFESMLTDIIDITSIRAEEKHPHINVNVSKDIPCILISDELRLSQVITNLLTNAIKFTPENGTIELSAEKLEESPCADGAPCTHDEITLKIAVADSGIGISPEQQKKLFTSYNQADSSITKNFGGTGLGLAISKRIVELMQGAIWIESQLGKGAKFIFTVKVKKGTGNAGKDSHAGSPAESDEAGLNFKDCTILIAEDVEINREIISALLENTGITIDFAENGKLAVSMFTEHPGKYSLIFMDVHMPEMDGDEATRAIRALELPQAKQIPIIAMTADVFQEDIEKCRSAGMNDHVTKPIVPKDIYAKLKKYLGS
jgi:signal transduction histidine kinase